MGNNLALIPLMRTIIISLIILVTKNITVIFSSIVKIKHN